MYILDHSPILAQGLSVWEQVETQLDLEVLTMLGPDPEQVRPLLWTWRHRGLMVVTTTN